MQKISNLPNVGVDGCAQNIKPASSGGRRRALSKDDVDNSPGIFVHHDRLEVTVRIRLSTPDMIFFCVAVSKRPPSTLRLSTGGLVRNYSGASALFVAVTGENPACVEVLLHAGKASSVWRE